MTPANLAAREVLVADSLVLTRTDRRVLDGLSLAPWPGRWTAIVGPNGAGKSTLLRVLAGLEVPQAGQVSLQGRPIGCWDRFARARQLAWLDQQGAIDIDLEVSAVVMLGRLPHIGLHGLPQASDRQAVEQAMRATRSDMFVGRRLSALSGGERQRVLLARVLATEAPVMLLDEPTSHLDAPNLRLLATAIRERVARGNTVVSVVHDLNMALSADRLAVMQAGRLLAEGNPGERLVHQALEAAFEGAISVLPMAAGRRWIALNRD